MIGFTVFVLYVGIGALLFARQRSFIYYPTPAIQHPFAETVYRNEGHTINSISIRGGMKNAILYFGGNGESVAYSAGDLNARFKSRALHLVDYRGYGGSSGSPSEQALFSDAIHIYDKLSKQHDNITLIGRSLGSGVASYVAAQRDVSKLVLVTPFDSIRNIAQKRFPVYPMSLLLKDQFDSAARAPAIKAKVLILAAQTDRVVPMQHTQSLLAAFKAGNADMLVIENSGHNGISGFDTYYESIDRFIAN